MFFLWVGCDIYVGNGKSRRVIDKGLPRKNCLLNVSRLGYSYVKRLGLSVFFREFQESCFVICYSSETR